MPGEEQKPSSVTETHSLTPKEFATLYARALKKLVTFLEGTLSRAVSPEREVFMAAAGLYFYLHALNDPQQLVEFYAAEMHLELQPQSIEVALLYSIAVAFGLLVHGAKRVVFERYPYYKAFVTVYLLGMYENEAGKEDEY
jgi:hypothetical protein